MIPAILAALGEASAGAGAAASFAGGAGAAGGGEAAASLAGVTKQIGQLQTATTALSPSMSKFVSAITFLPNQLLQAKAAITTTFDTFVHALAAPLETVKHLGDSISGFVRLSNPAAVSMFEYRVENAFASIGKIVEPILGALGRAADTLNVTFNKLAPAIDPAIQAVVSFIDTVTTNLGPAIDTLAPAAKLAGMLMLDLARATSAAMKPIAFVLELFSQFDPLHKLLGGADGDDKKSVAARPARLSSIEQIQREGAQASITATLAAQTGEKKATTEGLLEMILRFLNENLSREAIKKMLTELWEMIEKHLPNIPSVPRAGDLSGLGIGGILAQLR